MNTRIKSLITTAALALTLSHSAAVSAASDTRLQPLQAHTVSLENHTAVVYYTKLDNGDFRVNATVGPNLGTVGLISQHKVIVKPGQSYTWSLETEVAKAPAVIIQMTADDNKLVVASR